MIKLLKKRGFSIKNQEWDEVKNIENEIIKLKNEKFDWLTRPRSAFITFESEEGFNRALLFKKKLKDAKRGDPGWEIKHFLKTCDVSASF